MIQMMLSTGITTSNLSWRHSCYYFGESTKDVAVTESCGHCRKSVSTISVTYVLTIIIIGNTTLINIYIHIIKQQIQTILSGDNILIGVLDFEIASCLYLQIVWYPCLISFVVTLVLVLDRYVIRQRLFVGSSIGVGQRVIICIQS